MTRRALALACLAATVTAAPTSSAPERRFRSAADYLQLELPTGVKVSETPVLAGDGTTLVASFRGPGLVAAITRVDFPNRPAWRRDRRYFRDVESGLAAATPGYERRRRSTRRLGKVPALDVDFSRKAPSGDRERVFARFLLFRTFTVTAMVATPAPGRQSGRRAAAMRDSFQPYFAGD